METVPDRRPSERSRRGRPASSRSEKRIRGFIPPNQDTGLPQESENPAVEPALVQAGGRSGRTSGREGNFLSQCYHPGHMWANLAWNKGG